MEYQTHTRTHKREFQTNLSILQRAHDMEISPDVLPAEHTGDDNEMAHEVDADEQGFVEMNGEFGFSNFHLRLKL